MLYERLVQFFDQGWFVARNDEQTFLRLLYSGKQGEWVCYAQAIETEHLFIFYSVWPTLIDPGQRVPVTELLTRINYGLKVGNFELDVTDGEVRYKTSVLLENDAWEDAVIRPVVYYNLAMMDYYWPALQALIRGSSPAAALTLAEAE